MKEECAKHSNATYLLALFLSSIMIVGFMPMSTFVKETTAGIVRTVIVSIDANGGCEDIKS